MTFKVMGFKEYVYICISLHSVGLKVLRENKIVKEERPTRFAAGRGFLCGTVFNQVQNAYSVSK